MASLLCGALAAWLPLSLRFLSHPRGMTGRTAHRQDLPSFPLLHSHPLTSRSQLQADAAQSRASVCWKGSWPRGESCRLPGLWPPLSQLRLHSARVGVAGPCSILRGEHLQLPSLTLLPRLWDKIMKCRLVIVQENKAPVKSGLRCSRWPCGDADSQALANVLTLRRAR